MSTEILDVDDTDSGWFQGKTMNIKYLPIYFLKHLEKTCYCKDHGVKRSRFGKYIQKWIHTPFQYYQMD